MLRLLQVLLLLSVSSVGLWLPPPAAAQEYPSYDGFYHNQHFASWGSIEAPLLRMGGGPVYSDHTYEPVSAGRPNPRSLSQALFDDVASDDADDTEASPTSLRNRTALGVFFAQQVFSELTDGDGALVGCPVEYFDIEVPKCDPHFDPECSGRQKMPFARTAYLASSGQAPSAPRSQLSSTSAWLDGGSIYGSGKTWSDVLRSRRGGRLLTSDETTNDLAGSLPALNSAALLPFINEPPPTDNPGPVRVRHPRTRSVHDMLLSGNKVANSNPALLALQVLWFRNHNYHADRLAALYATNANDTYWTDERLFLEARKWNVAEYQVVVAYDWLPSFTGLTLSTYNGYLSTTSPAISEVFHLAATRYIATVMPSALARRDLSDEAVAAEGTCVFRSTTNAFGEADRAALRTCNTYSRGSEILTTSEVDNSTSSVDAVAELLVGLASQLASREDMRVVDDVRNFAQGPVNYNRQDLVAHTIQRGRDHGLPSYNAVRVAYGLDAKTTFEEVTSDPVLREKLRTLYSNSTRRIDLFVGAMLETNDDAEGNPGELFSLALRDQFTRVRDGDRFWFENVKVGNLGGLFSADEIASLKNTTFADIMRRLTDLDETVLPESAFILAADSPCHAEQARFATSNLENCSLLATHDFWTDTSSSALPGTAMLFVGFFIICLLGVGAMVVTEGRKRKQLMADIERSFSKPLRPFDSAVLPPPPVAVHHHTKTVAIMPAGFSSSSSSSPPRKFGGGAAADTELLSPPVARVKVAITLPSVDERFSTDNGNALATAPPPLPSSEFAPLTPEQADAAMTNRGVLEYAGLRLAPVVDPSPPPPSAPHATESLAKSVDYALHVVPPPQPPVTSSEEGEEEEEEASRVYATVLYAPSMGTASTYAEILERAVEPTPTRAAPAPAATTSTGGSSSARIDPGSSVGWLSVRSAASSGERLYHVPLAFVHSIVVFGSRARAREQSRLAAAAHDGLMSPVSTNTRPSYSCSAMTRLAEELRANPDETLPFSPSSVHGGGLATNLASSPQGAFRGAFARVTGAASALTGVGAAASNPTPDDDPYEPLRNRSILIRVPKRYDVWLVFPDLRSRASFVLDLQAACGRAGGRSLGGGGSSGGGSTVVVRSGCFSRALLGLEAGSGSPKTTRVRTAELTRFFQHLISSSVGTLPTARASAAAASTSSSAQIQRQRQQHHQPLRLDPVIVDATAPPPAANFRRTPSQQPRTLPQAPSSSTDATPLPPLPAAVAPAHQRPPTPVSHLYGGGGGGGGGSSLVSLSRRPSYPRVPSTGSAGNGNGAGDPSAAAAHLPLASAMHDLHLDLEQAEALLDIEVTLGEFADALELEETHAFPRYIFRMADRARTGLVSFRALEHVLLTLSKGAQEAKLALLFDLYDLNGSGWLEVEEVTTMLRESLRTSDEYFDTPDREARVEQEVAEAVTEMYRKLDRPPGDAVDLHDFQIMMTATPRPAATRDTPEHHRQRDNDITTRHERDVTIIHAGGATTPPPPPPEKEEVGDSNSQKKEDATTSSASSPADAAAAAATVSPATAASPSKPSILQRLLQRRRASPRRGAAAAAGSSLPPSSTMSSPPPPMKASHKKASSNASKPHHRPNQSSWTSDAGFSPAGPPLVPSSSSSLPAKMERLDSHVIMTQMPGDAHDDGDDRGRVGGRTLGGHFGGVTKRRSRIMRLRTFINTYRSHIFILALFYLATFGIFAERFWHFATQIEHVGIRRITEWSVPITRGCASAMAFTLSLLLLTVCKNLLSYLQTTRVARFLPLASAISFHILVAYTCAAFTLGHVVGHFFNWYQISTQTPADMNCYLPDIAYSSDFLPSFTFWWYQTPTNMTGVILTLWMIFFYVVASCRNYVYAFFLLVHRWFILVYILVIMHGMHQLFAYPVTWPFLIGPATIYIFDRLWSLARINAPLTVLSAQILPSKVLKLTIARPAHLTYTSGQYLRLSSDYLGRNHWHPFSVTSAPNHDYLSVHVRAVGPWTYRLYQLYHPMHLQRRPEPVDANAAAAAAAVANDDSTPQKPSKVVGGIAGSGVSGGSGAVASYGAFMDKVRAGFVARSSSFYLPPLNVDGPFGGGHTEWAKYRTVILVGAGIGITPFASILQDFVHRCQLERMQEKERERMRRRRRKDAEEERRSTTGITKKNANGQRVPVGGGSTHETASAAPPSSSSRQQQPLLLYFIWIGRSHAGYEWLIDLIREAESIDHASGKLHIQVQMYITTPPNQFDLRTAISYAFERHFDRVNGCSLFSGLRSSIGWGRPDFNHLFELIAARHPSQEIGVFSSGGPSVLSSVQKGCDRINSFQGSHFHHYAEQFQ